MRRTRTDIADETDKKTEQTDIDRQIDRMGKIQLFVTKEMREREEIEERH